MHPTMLRLEDGKSYKGWSFNNSVLSLGEVVFNTGMTGYQEIISDPSYCGQIIIFTYPEIGNTGINQEDMESNKIYIKGIIAKNISFYPSNWRSQLSFVDYLSENNIPHIFGIDTRALAKHLRNCGTMNGCIFSENLNSNNIFNMLNSSPSMQGNNLVNEVTTQKVYKIYNYHEVYKKYLSYKYLSNNHISKSNTTINIVVLDLGVKRNIINRLLNYECEVYILPANSSYKVVQQYNPHGIVLSNGPGDPASMKEVIDNVEEIIQKFNIPILGICMGHQILSLALNLTTFKLKFGHRGMNHPTGIGKKAEITSQNHGFAVQFQSLYDDDIYITHVNLNDLTVAGIIHKTRPIFSVQYHPEASPGPHDSEYLFNHFFRLIKITKSKN
uniref:Carbamoyl phosphate synthase small chain n=1 Tax=Riquetophycus sp. TaxID=1897556 RepID=A0A1C9C896_9FLOR|nr:carbamoyl-phosphate synthase arginine-specific small subunit [Riquetophycus sp.]